MQVVFVIQAHISVLFCFHGQPKIFLSRSGTHIRGCIQPYRVETRCTPAVTIPFSILGNNGEPAICIILEPERQSLIKILINHGNVSTKLVRECTLDLIRGLTQIHFERPFWWIYTQVGAAFHNYCMSPAENRFLQRHKLNFNWLFLSISSTVQMQPQWSTGFNL